MGVGVAEGVVRWMYPEVHLRREFHPGIHEFHETRGFANQSSYVGYYADYLEKVPTRTNRQGFRGREFHPGDLQCAERILVLGDSTTFGLGVRDEQTFCVRLETMLRDRGHDVVVWNAGVTAYGTAESLATLRELLPERQPTLVLLGWLNNDFTMDPTAAVVHRHHVINGYLCANAEAYERLRRRKLEPRLSHASHLYKMLALNFKLKQHRASLGDKIEEAFAAQPQSRKTVQASAEAVGRIREEAVASGAGFLLLSFPTSREVAAGRRLPSARAFEEELSQRGTPWQSLLEPFTRGGSQGDRQLFLARDDWHPNGHGHEVTARAILDWWEANRSGAVPRAE